MAIDYSQIPSPCYLLHEEKLLKNLSLIQSVKQQADINIILALKGFAMWHTFPLIAQYIHGAAASSVNEARLIAEEMGVKAHTYSPAYTEDTIEEIAQYSSHITFNSLSQFHRFKHKLALSPDIKLGLRINPEFSEVETDLYNPCSPGSRLGVIAADLPPILPEEISGLHFHTLCESSSYNLEKVLEAVEEKFASYLTQISWINMGGGHLMTRKGYDIPHLVNLLRQFKNKYKIDIILEPGSAFAWETGDLVSSVVDIVENKGIKTAILDVSFTAHMPDCLEMPYKPRITNSLVPSLGKPTYRMGGNSCLSGDYMGDWSFDTPLQIGDRVIFEDMIHYTMVKTSTFNGVGHPAIGIWTKHNTFKLVKAFDFGDYRNRLS